MAKSRVDRRLRFLRDGVNANFTVACKDRTWRVDSSMLAAESEYFEKLCHGEFSVCAYGALPATLASSTELLYMMLISSQEASERVVAFPEEEPEVIDQILVYIYTFAYDDLAIISKETADTQTSADGATGAVSETGNDEATEMSQGAEEQSDKEESGTAEAVVLMKHTMSHWKCASEFPEVNVFEQGRRDIVTKVLKTAILVYRCAKMMGLWDLQHLVFLRFMEKERYFIISDLPAILETVYQNTEAADEHLRLEVTHQCIKNHRAIKFVYPVCINVLEQYENSSWMIGTKLQGENARLSDEVLIIQATSDARKNANETITGELKGANERVADLKEDLEDVQHEWAKLPFDCNCGRAISTGKWIQTRSFDGRYYRLQYMCRCSKKYVCDRRR